jgi:hypothetical protein
MKRADWLQEVAKTLPAQKKRGGELGFSSPPQSRRLNTVQFRWQTSICQSELEVHLQRELNNARIRSGSNVARLRTDRLTNRAKRGICFVHVGI